MAFGLLEKLPDPPAGKDGWPWTEQSDPLPETQPDGSPWPKISIVTPSYNQGRFIEETIRSVLLQRYPNLEYIVMDGGSTDESVEIIKKYDPWIDSWASEEDEGQSDAINKGFERATGEIYAWLNSDDFYAAGALRSIAKAFLKKSAEVGAIVGVGHKIDEEGSVVYTPSKSELTREAFLNWLNGGSFMQPACFFRRAMWEKCGPLRADLKYAMDIDFFLNAVRKYRFESVDKTISFAHKHEGAKTTGERHRWRAEVIFQLYEHGGRREALNEVEKMSEVLIQKRNQLSQLKRMNSHPVFKWAMRLWRHLLN